MLKKRRRKNCIFTGRNLQQKEGGSGREGGILREDQPTAATKKQNYSSLKCPLRFQVISLRNLLMITKNYPTNILLLVEKKNTLQFYLQGVCILFQSLVDLGNRKRWQCLLYVAGALEECINNWISHGKSVILSDFSMWYKLFMSFQRKVWCFYV